MTAKTKDGKEIYRDSRIYMPFPQQFGRGDRMGRGPYEKSGLIRETSLHPHETVTERFDIVFPDNVFDMDIKVELWYMPYGTKQIDAFLWNKAAKTLSVSKTGK